MKRPEKFGEPVKRQCSPFYALCGAVVVLAAIFAVELFLAKTWLIIWPDSLGYLGPAYQRLTTGILTHSGGRGFVYPLLLSVAMGGQFQLVHVVTAQKILLFLTFMLVCWWSLSGTRRYGGKIGWACCLSSVLILLGFVTYLPTFGLAHAIMPETLFLFGATTVGLLLLIQCNFQAPSAFVEVLLGSVCIFLSVVLYLVKPHWFFGGLVSCLLCFLFCLSSGHPRRLLRFTTICVIVVLSCLTFNIDQRLAQKYDQRASLFLPRTLVSIHIPMVLKYLRETDSQASGLPEELRQQLISEMSKAVQNGPEGGWNLLGFNGDTFMYGPSGRLHERYMEGSISRERQYCLQLFLGGLRTDPFWYVKKVAGQMLWAFTHPLPYPAGCYETTDQTVQEMKNRYPQIAGRQDFGNFSRGLVESAIFPRRLVRCIHLALLLLYFFLVGGSTALIVASATKRRLIHMLKTDKTAVAFLSIFLVQQSVNLLVATVHSFDPLRYSQMQLGLVSLLCLAAMMFLAKNVEREVLLVKPSES